MVKVKFIGAKNLFGQGWVIETGNIIGNMNTAKSFYPEGCTEEDRKRIFLARRLFLGDKFDFDGYKMFMADQTDNKGSYLELTKDYVEANPCGWTDIKEDILIIAENLQGVVAGHPVADCPVVMASDNRNQVIAIGHCSADRVDRYLPVAVIDALSSSHNSKDEDISVYISAGAGTSWTYDKFPAWAKDEKVWKDCIVEDNSGLFHIDLKKAIITELQERNISNIIDNSIDTITDSRFYSNSAARKDDNKAGRNFAGAFYPFTKIKTIGTFSYKNQI